MELSSSIARELETAIRSDPSWKKENWPRKDVNELLLPLSRYIRANGASSLPCPPSIRPGVPTSRSFSVIIQRAKIACDRSHVSLAGPKSGHMLVAILYYRSFISEALLIAWYW